MRTAVVIALAAAAAGPLFAEWVTVLSEDFEGAPAVRLEGAAQYVPGRDSQALKLSGDGRVQVAAPECPTGAGRIEMDICPTQIIPPRTDGKHWMLLTDVGANSAWPGATVVYFDRDTAHLRYGVFDGGWHWLDASAVTWTPGQWRHLALSWGAQGRTLEVDGNVVARDDYAGGIRPRRLQVGYFDGYSEAAPVLVDSLRIAGECTDAIVADNRVLCPQVDGLLDQVQVRWRLVREAVAEIGLYAGEREVARLYGPQATPAGRQVTACDGATAPSGDYQLRLTARRADGQVQVATAALALDRELKWAPAPTVVQDWFPLGVWYFWELDASYINRLVDDAGRAAAYYEATLADLQNLGVDTIVANWTPRVHRTLLLDTAHRHGIRVIVHLDEVNSFIWNPQKFASEDCVAAFRSAIAEVSGHPATAGYYLVDEPAPTAENIANIRLCRRLVEALDPAHPGFSCLNTGWDVIFPQVGYPVLLVDIYPLYSAHLSGDTLTGYLAALDAAHAAAAGAPLWLIPQNFGFKPRPESIPGPNEMTLLCWEGVARGAKGLIHFIYQSTTEIQGERLAGVVTDDLKPLDHRYAETKALHQALAPLRPTLLGLTRQAQSLATAGAGFDVQTFTDRSGAPFLIVVNQDLVATRTAALRWLDGAPKVKAVANVANGAIVGDGEGAALSLAPGSGALLRLEP
jgi:hypothetical protein